MLIENNESKQILEYTKEVNTGKLMSEIYAALPELTPQMSNNTWDIKLRLFTNGDNVTLWVPDDVDKAVIDSVLNKHIPYEEVIDDAISTDK